MASETKNKKSSKALPIFFFLMGVMASLASIGEIGELLILVAFLSWVICLLIDASNEPPIARAASIDQWLDERDASMTFDTVHDYTVGPTGARPEFHGANAVFQVDPNPPRIDDTMHQVECDWIR